MRIIRSENPRPLMLVALNTDGLLAAGSPAFGAGGDVELWNAASGQHHFTYRTPSREPRSLFFTRDGRSLLVGEDLGIAVIDLATRLRADGPKAFGRLPKCALALNGEKLVCADTVRVGETARSRFVCYATPLTAASVFLWKVEPPDGFGYFSAPAIDPAGRTVAVCASSLGSRGTCAEIQIRDAATGAARVAIPTDGARPVLGLTFSANGAKLLARTESNTVQLFDVATGTPAGELAHRGRSFVSGFAVHPAGPVACARSDGTVTFWDAEACRPLRTLDWRAGRLVSVAFAPDGALAAAGTEDGKIVVWDVE
jgi:WD40 repeat protein